MDRVGREGVLVAVAWLAVCSGFFDVVALEFEEQGSECGDWFDHGEVVEVLEDNGRRIGCWFVGKPEIS